MDFSIAVLPGDGIGPEVIGEAVKILQVVGVRFGHCFDVRSGAIGGGAIDACGTALPAETLALCQGVDAVLFGASGGPQWDIVDAPVRPEAGILASEEPQSAGKSWVGARMLRVEDVPLRSYIQQLLYVMYFKRMGCCPVFFIADCDHP